MTSAFTSARLLAIRGGMGRRFCEEANPLTALIHSPITPIPYTIFSGCKLEQRRMAAAAAPLLLLLLPTFLP